VPLPAGLQDAAVRRAAAGVAIVAILPLAALAHAIGQSQTPGGGGAAFVVRSLQHPAERREARPDVLDTPILPGSVIKVVTLVAALESQVIEPDTARICRRTVTVDGRHYACSHPDLKRPLTPAEALAYSCNDYFVSLAPRLPRQALNTLRQRLGLAPIGADANYAAALVGLDGPRVAPRILLDVIARLAGADPDRPVPMTEATRRVLREGLTGAARFGTASALGARGISALAKTGTAPMPGGSFLGLVIALEPADKPTRGVVVVTPGAAGLDAASIAADVLQTSLASAPPPAASSPAPLPRSQSPSATASMPPAQRPTAATTAATPVMAPPPSMGPSTVRIGLTSSGGKVIEMDLEDYVARVIAGEGPPKAADAAQQALAITVRTFALANRNRHRREGFDFCDTTHCQVFRAATDAARRAALATEGKVLMHDGQPASVFYSALCGGKTELASEVWPGSIDYVTAPQVDTACAGEPGWTSEVRADQIERALRAEGYRGDRLRNLRILQRDTSGRVSRLQVDGFSPNEIAGYDFRMVVGRVVGWQMVKSTAFEIERTGSGYRFRGRGFGHGVGLCVIGAANRAAAGGTADDILRFYFPTLTVANYRQPLLTSNPRPDAIRPAPPAVTPPPSAVPAAPAPAPAAADVQIAVPSGEEGDRARLVDLVRSARDAIASAASVKAPASIRLTVHPTVEAFARATGQPWWVSGASDGTGIDLLPLTILRQRGQLERTVRHEVAHVLLDSAFAGRPLWVREGAAFYFADPSPPGSDLPSHGPCPKDDEFLRPISPGAHRAAYAKAEACFRKAVAGGKSWRDVR